MAPWNGPNYLRLPVYAVAGTRSDDFVVGLTNVSAEEVAPELWDYTVCGQYPGSVSAGATVSLQCNDTVDLPPARHVVVQLPVADERINFCEIDVCANGTRTKTRHF